MNVLHNSLDICHHLKFGHIIVWDFNFSGPGPVQIRGRDLKNSLSGPVGGLRHILVFDFETISNKFSYWGRGTIMAMTAELTSKK